MEDEVVGGQKRSVKQSVSTIAGPRRRQIAIEVRKDRKDALLKSKRLRWESSNGMTGGDDVAISQLTEDIKIAVQKLRESFSSTSSRKSTDIIASLTKLRHHLSSSQQPPFHVAVEAGAIPLLTNCLSFGSPEEQLVNAAWCLSNIAGGTSEDTMAVLPASALLIAHMGDKSPISVIEHCTWAVSNLSAEGSEVTQTLLRQGLLPALTRLLLAAAADVALSGLGQTVAWALTSVLKVSGARTAVDLVRTAGVPSAIVRLLSSGNEPLTAEVAWLLVYITAKSDSCAEALLNAAVAAPLVQLAHSTTQPVILTPVVRTVGNITAMDNGKTDILLTAGTHLPGGTLGALYNGLNSTHRSVVKETAWAVSNIAGGSEEHKRACRESPIFQRLIDIFKSSAFDLKREAGFALANLCVGPLPTRSQESVSRPAVQTDVLVQLVQAGCLPVFLSFVRSSDMDAARLGLQFVELVLSRYPDDEGPRLVEMEDGIDALETLQFSENEELRVMSTHLVDTFFGADYGDN